MLIETLFPNENPLTIWIIDWKHFHDLGERLWIFKNSNRIRRFESISAKKSFKIEMFNKTNYHCNFSVNQFISAPVSFPSLLSSPSPSQQFNCGKRNDKGFHTQYIYQILDYAQALSIFTEHIKWTEHN